MKNLKSILILLTTVELLYFFIVFYDQEFWVKMDNEYKINIILGLFHIIVVGIFIKNIWNDNLIENKEKVNNSLMIVFLGIIGMWIWLPKNT